MTITSETVKEKRNRTQTRIPIMSCVSNQVLFNKSASKFFSLPFKISFEKLGNLFIGFKDDKEGFEIHLSSNGSFAINSRPLINKLQKIFKCRKPKFFIKSTYSLTKFELKFIEK